MVSFNALNASMKQVLTFEIYIKHLGWGEKVVPKERVAEN